jgi:hypothetical protein
MENKYEGYFPMINDFNKDRLLNLYEVHITKSIKAEYGDYILKAINQFIEYVGEENLHKVIHISFSTIFKDVIFGLNSDTSKIYDRTIRMSIVPFYGQSDETDYPFSWLGGRLRDQYGNINHDFKYGDWEFIKGKILEYNRDEI